LRWRPRPNQSDIPPHLSGARRALGLIADGVANPAKYTPDGKREFLDGKSFVEAFVVRRTLAESLRNLETLAES
jgi:hypothetical protein